MDKGTPIGKIPLILISGFLGSGKTSLLKQILRVTGSEKRIAIVQNEFAPGKVDSKELQSTGLPFELLEVNNGSVFCACLLDDFVQRLGDFVNKYRPEAIFLEATGLADPVSMGQILQSPEVEDHIFLGGIWTVIDCQNFEKSHQFIQRVRHQVQIADIILLNKSDVVIPGESLIQIITDWNPFAKQYQSKEGLFTELGIRLTESLGSESIKTLNLVKIKSDSLPKPDIGSCVIRTQKLYNREKIRKFYSDNQDKIFRMKGYLRAQGGEYYLVQAVFDSFEFREAKDWSGPTEIIIIGPGIKPGPISREFLNFGTNE